MKFSSWVSIIATNCVYILKWNSRYQVWNHKHTSKGLGREIPCWEIVLLDIYRPFFMDVYTLISNRIFCYSKNVWKLKLFPFYESRYIQYKDKLTKGLDHNRKVREIPPRLRLIAYGLFQQYMFPQQSKNEW